MASSSSTKHELTSSSPRRRYDVFLSFRGEDVRYNFVAHLFADLERNGVYFFRDNLNIQRGEVIGPDLVNAIEESRIYIIIFSVGYADSTWCLNELVDIMERRREFGGIVIPVFYGVDPSDVRSQKYCSFEEAFHNHEIKFKDDLEKVQRWRGAMTEAGHLGGFHLQCYRTETDFIRDIVKETLSHLPGLSLATSDRFVVMGQRFVGMGQRLKQLSNHIGTKDHKVKFIGILGMGGIGKTTLAEEFYDEMSNSFDGSCFLKDVRENSEKNQLVSLQVKILSKIFSWSHFQVSDVRDGMRILGSRLQCLKVLLVIDDVDHVDQLTSLAGNRGWFGLGSIIIITTRDEHVLVEHEVDIIYKVKCLDDIESLQLLSLKAFKKIEPPADFLELCSHISRYCDGLPLALTIIGSFLFGRGEKEWNSALQRLREESEKEVLDKLRISYDGLKENEKNIFLDIAFFFKGAPEYMTKEILASCGFHPEIGMKVLIEKCLISISCEGYLLMHDLLREMAKKIVESTSKEPGKRTRLSQGADAANVLMSDMGTETVEGIAHNFPPPNLIKLINMSLYLNPKAFDHMKNLRILKISGAELPRGLINLPNKLRCLIWEFYPLKNLPSNFEPKDIVALQLNNSYNIGGLWNGTKHLNMLKYVILDDCWKLTETPDFTFIPNVELLSLQSCKRLYNIHPSIGRLTKLTTLNMRDCKSLVSLPDFISLESLKICDLSGCSELKNFPNITGETKSIELFNISGTGIKDFPCSDVHMKNLQILRCKDCKGEISMPRHFLSFWFTSEEPPMPFKLHSLSALHCLTWLDLSYCNLEEADIPNDLWSLSLLKMLDLSGNYFVNLPRSIDGLSRLIRLCLDDCKRLKSLPVFLNFIPYVSVRDCTLLETSLELQSLVESRFFGMNCFKLVEIEGGSNMALAIMKRYLLSTKYRYRSHNIYPKSDGYPPFTIKEEPKLLEVLFPGSQVPEWFSLQSEGNSVVSEKLDRSDDNYELIGYAMSCIFSAQNWKTLLDLQTPLFSGGDIFDVNFLRLTINDTFHWRLPYTDRMADDVCDHIWLLFFPIKFIKLHHVRDLSQIGVRFTSHAPGVVVKQCAIRQVFQRDVYRLV